MKRKETICFILLLLGISSIPCCPPVHGDESAPSGSYAVTTSWLECCLRDVAGPDIDVVRICPPGTCPGHFDITPGTFNDLKRCHILFLFDFQQSLQDKLDIPSENSPKVIPIKAPEGLCIPSRYLDGCRSVHEALVNIHPEKREVFDEKLEKTRLRMATLEHTIHEKMLESGLTGAKVISSGRQAAFCRWLELVVSGTLTAGDMASPGALKSLIGTAKKEQVLYIVANLQEGPQLGATLAEHTGAKVAVFSNFPSMREDQDTFDELALYNLARLMAAADK